MTLERVFVSAGCDPYAGISFTSRLAELIEEGKTCFSQKVVAPSFWSDTAVEILASRYLSKRAESPMENDLRQAIERLVKTWGESLANTFESPSERAIYLAEMKYLLAHQMASPNSPQWFNTGLVAEPQAHACFIQSVRDVLLEPGGIMDLWLREAAVFKQGSGSGTNFSRLRAAGEPLSGGGVSSGVISFLRIGDVAAGSIRSAGTNRRAAKMVLLDVDHPEIREFIDWKKNEEQKVEALVVGSQTLHASNAEFPLFDFDWRGEAYQTVSGQNSNNSVRVSDAFMRSVETDGTWFLKERVGNVDPVSIRSLDLWEQIAKAAWACADPGLQFETRINEWHTCASDGPIVASNPCAEYFFLDDTGCNLASLNLISFYDEASGTFLVDRFTQAVRLWVMTLDTTVSFAGYPTERIAQRSRDYRTLGLGFANLGALLMRMGLGYGSAEGRSVAASLTALLTGEAYLTSAKLAERLGPFKRFKENKESMLHVIQKHVAALEEIRAPVADLLSAARKSWRQALSLGEHSGFRNAQVSAIAPTGTIGLVMDCDTMGIEPEFSLRKRKVLAGGGSLLMVNQSVRSALVRLGYARGPIESILSYINGHGHVLGAPGLRPEHLSVFDCASGPSVDRTLGALAHLEMVAAVQPFVSGGVSKTVNLPHSATVADVEQVHRSAWKLGLKSISLYREGSKKSQPLSSQIECVQCD
jgi:ribonucleoside-diphosphate reductase alpha chain